MILRSFLFVLLVFSLSGCVRLAIDKSIAAYDSVASQIQLGDKKDKVLSILLPSQEGLPKNAMKRPEQYIKDGVKVEIYFMRSARVPDGLTTDDEFTPYIFNNDILVGIGWTVLGGPKTQGQVTPEVNVQQNVVVH